MKKEFVMGIFICILLGGLSILQEYSSRKMLYLPEGEKMLEIPSPNKEYQLNIYYIEGGSISADAIRGEIETKNQSWNVYFRYKDFEKPVGAKWLDNETIEINGESINILNNKRN